MPLERDRVKTQQGAYYVVPPGAFPKSSLTGISSRVLKSRTIFTSSSDPFIPFHKIRKASLVDPSIWFCLVTVVATVPSACLGVSTVYITEPVSESRMVVLRMSPSSFGAKDRVIFREVIGSGDERYGGS